MNFLDYFPNHMIQTFDDREFCKKDPSLTILVDGDKIFEDELRWLNSMGAGIFFTPNQFNGSRKKDTCLGINAWFMECDNLSKAEQKQMIEMSPLKPSFIVETNKSLHTYWLAENGTTDNFEIIQRRLIYNFQADEACKDVSRVLRIPGYNHNKNKDPFPVKLVYENPTARYTEAQMLEAFKPEVKEKKYANIWDAMTALDNVEVLSRASGTSIVNGESITFRPRPTGGFLIDVNGKPADAWIDIEGLIGSGKHGGPTWIQWLKYYGRSPKEIFSWAMKNLNDLLPELEEEIRVKDIEWQHTDKKKFSWGVPVLDEHATIIQAEQYNVLAGETGCGKTTFCLQMAIENAYKYRVLYVSMEMSNEALLMRYALNRLGVTPKQWRDGNFDREGAEKIISSMPENLFMKKMEGGLSIDEIEKTIRKGGYDLVFLDNFGFIQVSGNTQNEQVQNASRRLKWLANETGTCIIALHHFRKRQSDKECLIRPLDSMMGSAKLSHDVNLVIQVARRMDSNATQDEREDFYVAIQKDRDFGQTKVFKTRYTNGKFV